MQKVRPDEQEIPRISPLLSGLRAGRGLEITGKILWVLQMLKRWNLLGGWTEWQGRRSVSELWRKHRPDVCGETSPSHVSHDNDGYVREYPRVVTVLMQALPTVKAVRVVLTWYRSSKKHYTVLSKPLWHLCDQSSCFPDMLALARHVTDPHICYWFQDMLLFPQTCYGSQTCYCLADGCLCCPHLIVFHSFSYSSSTLMKIFSTIKSSLEAFFVVTDFQTVHDSYP